MSNYYFLLRQLLQQLCLDCQYYQGLSLSRLLLRQQLQWRVCNENVYTSKKFDKLVLYLSENENSKKFTNFTFTDSVSNMPFETTGTGDKMVSGKHIIPITSTDGTAKATGQHLTIKIDSTDSAKIELFGALIHNRTTT